MLCSRGGGSLVLDLGNLQRIHLRKNNLNIAGTKTAFFPSFCARQVVLSFFSVQGQAGKLWRRFFFRGNIGPQHAPDSLK